MTSTVGFLHRLYTIYDVAVLDDWRRVAETGSRNQSPLVAFESARLEQLGDMMAFCQRLRLLFYGTASFSH